MWAADNMAFVGGLRNVRAAWHPAESAWHIRVINSLSLIGESKF